MLNIRPKRAKRSMYLLSIRPLAHCHSGFDFALKKVGKDDLEDALLAANTDDTISGILIYYPVFASGQDQYLQQLVSLNKDVEGLSHRYIFNMYQNIRFLDPPNNTQKSILPCTPLAVVKILEYLQVYNSFLSYGNRLHGRHIAVINRSEVVGRPLAALLANDGATVYSIDLTGIQVFSRGTGITKRRHEVNEMPGAKAEDVLPLCDVVISGVPSAKYKVPIAKIKDGAVCINFSSEKVFQSLLYQANSQNFDPEVKQKAAIYVPAIGKVTIAILLRNLLVSMPVISTDWLTMTASCTQPSTCEAATAQSLECC
jgi:methylenetetrahydrofolate dehydrogenase (NAD+)